MAQTLLSLKEILKERICPRCGRPYSTIERREINGKTYYYAVHYEYEYVNGRKKRTVKKCYLGPDVYDYTTRTHEKDGLAFMGLMHYRERIVYYLEAVINALSKVDINPADARRLAELLRRAADELEAAASPTN